MIPQKKRVGSSMTVMCLSLRKGVRIRTRFVNPRTLPIRNWKFSATDWLSIFNVRLFGTHLILRTFRGSANKKTSHKIIITQNRQCDDPRTLEKPSHIEVPRAKMD